MRAPVYTPIIHKTQLNTSSPEPKMCICASSRMPAPFLIPSPNPLNSPGAWWCLKAKKVRPLKLSKAHRYPSFHGPNFSRTNTSRGSAKLETHPAKHAADSYEYDCGHNSCTCAVPSGCWSKMKLVRFGVIKVALDPESKTLAFSERRLEKIRT